MLILALAGPARADEWDTFYVPLYPGYKTYILVMNYSGRDVEPEFEVMLDGNLYPPYQTLWTPPRTAKVRQFE